MKTLLSVVALWLLGAVPLGSLVGRLLRTEADRTVAAPGVRPPARGALDLPRSVTRTRASRVS